MIHPETPTDIGAVHRINEAAFGRPNEADLVDKLRSNNRAVLSLVAWQGEKGVGHILFFPLTIQGEAGVHEALGLGPLAVLPEFQAQGIGSALVRDGLKQLQDEGHSGVIVLGHPHYYPHFGFTPASNFGITCPFEVPDEAFMALELNAGGLGGKSGRAVYSPEFDEV